MLKPYTLKVDEKQLELLQEVSKRTHVPTSALIRKGIELVIRQVNEDILTPELRQEIDKLVNEDRNLLKRLADA